MKQSFDTVAIVARRYSDAIIASINAVEALLRRHGVDVLFGAQTLAAMEQHDPSGSERAAVADQEMGDRADLVVVVGGDGSLL